MDPKQLLDEAMRLSAEERADVDPDAEAAWSAEIRARLQRVDAGEVDTVPWAEAQRRIHAAAMRGSAASSPSDIT
ncbi:MAG: addiction module protein [Vicinamibacterales bacterium]